MFVIWTLGVAVVIFAVVKYLQGKRYKLPPGPTGLPFLGNIYQMDADSPHKTITEWSEKYGDVITMRNFGRTTVILNSYETIYEGLVTQANDFAGRVPSVRNNIVLCGCDDIETKSFSPAWVYRKKVSMQALKMYGENLENLEAITLDLIADMLEDLRKICTGEPQVLYPYYHKAVAGIVTSILYGEIVEQSKIDHYLELVDESMSLMQPAGLGVLVDLVPWLRFFPNHTYKTLSKCGMGMKKIIDEQIAKRRANFEPGNPQCFTDGLLDFQHKAREEGADRVLSDSEIYGINFNMFLGGTFTTSVTTNAFLAVLINKPEVQTQMYDEISREIGDRRPCLTDRKRLHYVEAAILEILRYSSMITLNSAHMTVADVKINGYDIPKGTEVLYNLWKLHHSPKYWEEPWEFRPERFLDKDGKVVPPGHDGRKRLLAFGASRRVCIGETLAKNRLFLLMTSLVQHFRFMPASTNERPRSDPRDYRPSFGIEPHHYKVKLEPRK